MGERRECDCCDGKATRAYVIWMIFAYSTGVFVFDSLHNRNSVDLDRRLTALEAAQKGEQK